ncbi:MAG TPA: PspA/IM30 family protein [Woeseiaceae bacterium]|jgi:phage shock protein A|nr:PspA/IM30 family protein [Woeseiaceae bacterium]
MALITRISRLFKADFNAVLDQIEEPELLLRQAIREMDDDLTARERRIRAVVHEEQALRARQQELSQSLGELDEEMGLCFASGKTDLARNLVRRKLEAERLIRFLNVKENGAAEYLNEQRTRLERDRMTLEGLRQKAEIFTSRAREPVDHPVAADAFGRDLTIGDDEVEVAFLREQARRQTS